MGDWCASASTDQNQKDRDNGRETAEDTGREGKTKKEENFFTGEVFFLLTNPIMGDPHPDPHPFVADFEELTDDPDERAIRQRDAYERASYLLNKLGVR